MFDPYKNIACREEYAEFLLNKLVKEKSAEKRQQMVQVIKALLMGEDIEMDTTTTTIISQGRNNEMYYNK